MLSAAEKKEIRQKINTNSVSFLIGDDCEIIVRLTEAGRKIYENTLFLRPSLKSLDNKGCYHFICTRMQAAQYFLRFGANAEILSPIELRQDFARFYRDASDLYTKSLYTKSDL